MAFVARTTRDSNRVGEVRQETGPALGPGSYESNASFRPPGPSFVPFGSTGERAAMPQDLVTPSPGTYAAPETMGVTRAPASDSFKSRTVRMRKPKVQQTPGPGRYDPVRGMAAEVQRRAQTGSGPPPPHPSGQAGQAGAAGASSGSGSGSGAPVKWVRVPTAPSIPAGGQSFGFEEGPHGELIMQRPINVGHTGRRGDTVGPGDYEPTKDAVLGRAKNADFSRSLTRRTDPSKLLGDASSNPGPGQYNVPASSSRGVGGEGGMARKQGSVFESGSARSGGGGGRKADMTPGPGAYVAKSSFSVAKTEEHLQFFGSTAQRFGAGPRSEARQYGTPGPGAYKRAAPSAFSIKTTSRLVPPTSVSVGFSSTNARFCGSAKAAAAMSLTGPGSYELPGMAEGVDKRMVGRTGVFGSSTKRFHKMRPDKVPGPGWYEAGEGVGDAFEPAAAYNAAAAGSPVAAVAAAPAAARFKPTATFASKEARVPEGSSSDVPPPGTYNITTKWKVGTGVGLVASGGSRFKTSKAVAQNPGPGRYSAASSFKRPNANRKNIMCSGEQRFHALKEKVPVPGPGSYDSEFLYGNMNKPTFNMSIAEGAR